MSDVVEKTLIALPSLLSLDSQPGAGKLSATSKLGTLIKSITELTSRHEEEKLIKKELAAIKEQVSSPNTSLRQMKEVMVRSIYCEMLGYEASFSYIHAIKLAQQGSVLEKRVGYLAVSLFLNESHNLLLLLVNTVLKDLQSTNLTEVCMALTVVSQVFPKDMIPAVLPLVEDKLTHSKEIIRRKAVLALYKFYLIAPNQVQHIHDKFRRALCDKDPGVMTASLHIYLQLIKESPSSYRDLTESFVAILKQVVGGKLPVDFNYHSVPAPWLQMQLLRILALLGKETQSTSELMYDLLDESLRRAEINHNITYAILYECVKTIYTIYPKSELLEKAAKCIGKFILSPKINLKYLGLKALTYVVQQDPNLALQHQMTIIECLDHPEPIVKRETLELLYRITNAQNVSIIVEKMLDFLRSSKEEYTTIDLVGKVAELAEKFAPDNSWFIQIMNSVFSMGGDVMQPEIPNNFLRLLAEGFDSAEEDTKLRLLAVDSYLSLLDSDPSLLPQRFLQVISWVLGEFSHLKVGLDPVVVHARLAALLSQGGVTTETQCWVLAAMSKLPVAGGAEPAEQRCAVGLDTTLRQLVTEMQVLSKNADLKARVLPREGCSVDPEVDSSLSFLDGFVSDALARGAAPYKPPHQRQEELSQGKGLNFEPYGMSLPISLSTCSLTDRHSPTALSVSSSLSGPSTDLPHKASSNGLKLEGVKRVWGKEGYLPQKEAAVDIEGVVDSCPVESSHQQGSSESKTAVFSTAAQQEQERRQLASSLFVGLGSQDALCLMGKSELRKQRFRRRGKAEEPSGTSEKGSDFYLDQLWDNPAPDSMAGCPPGELTSPSSHPRESCPSVGETTGGSEEGANSDAMGVTDRPPRDSSLVHHLPAELSGLLRSEIALLCSAESLSVHACRVYRDDALELVIFLSNSCTSSIQEVSFSLTSAHLQVFGGPADLLEELDTSGVAVIRHRLLMESPTAQTVTVDGRASYRSKHQGPCVLTFSVPLSLTDFIRPLRVSTEEYGRMWLSFSHDVKQNLKLLVDEEEPLTATLSALREKLQLHLVEVAGSEVIVACQLLPSQPCLLHCHAQDGSLAVWLRSSLPDLPDCLLYHCQKAIQES